MKLLEATQIISTKNLTSSRNLYNSENLKELPKLSESITETLCKFSPGAKLNLNWEEIKPPDLPLPKATATLIDDDFEGDISRKGHGLQRALIITLLQQLAVTVPREVTNKSEQPNAVKTENYEIIEPDLILAIEEPELYLHPLRCRYLSKLLSDLSIKDDVNGKNQILYATHSPFFIDLYKFDQIRLINKQKTTDSECANSLVTQFSLEQLAKELSKISDLDGKLFTKDSVRARSLPLMDTIANEGFFADAVVVVEGFGDMGALWAMQDVMGKNWSSLGVAIIPARGKNNIDRPVVIFRGFSIPTYFIYEYPVFPVEALREALLNAFSHRDFTKPGPIMIKQFKDRLEISNPGMFIGGVTPKNIPHHDPVARNRKLVEILQKTRLVNRSNMGVPRIFKNLLMEGKEPPEYYEDSETIKVIFPASELTAGFRNMIAYLTDKGHDPKVDHLLIIHYLMRHRRMTLQDAQEICYQGPERVMDEVMTELERIEVVKSIGKGRGRFFELTMTAQYSESVGSDTIKKHAALEKQFRELELVNKIRQKVKEWRDGGYRGVGRGVNIKYRLGRNSGEK